MKLTCTLFLHCVLHYSPEQVEALRKVLPGGPSSSAPSSSSSAVKAKSASKDASKAKDDGPKVLELRKVDPRTFGMSGAFMGADQEDDGSEVCTT